VNLWTDERMIPDELIQLLNIPNLPDELRDELTRASNELVESGAVTYPTKARIEHYLYKYREYLAVLSEDNRQIASEKTVDGRGGISFEGTAKILSIHLLKLTKQVLARASRRQKVALQRNTTAELDDLLEVYVLAAASLEAFINEFCWDRIDDIKSAGGEAYWLRGLEEIIGQKVEVRLKWKLVPQLLWQKAFDESKPPWQDFNVLINLRNSLLHYKMEYLPLGKVPKYLGHIQHLLSSKTQHTGRPRTLVEIERSQTWIDRICNLDVARWAFNTGVAMIRQFLEFADRESKEHYTWLLQGSGIRRIPDNRRRRGRVD